jgi:hypothetical protein
MPSPAKAEIPKVRSGDMALRESDGPYSGDGESFLSLNGGPGPMAIDGQGTMLQRMQELLDQLTWIRIELADSHGAQAKSDSERIQRALAQTDKTLELVRQLILGFDAERRPYPANRSRAQPTAE